MSEKYNLEFLEQKLGEFYKESEYPSTSILEGSLIYIEKENKKELDAEIQRIKEDRNPAYIWGFTTKNNAVYASRATGENKIFIYNANGTIKKTEYIKGKLKVLNNLSEDTIDDLFDQKAVFDYFYKRLWKLRLDLAQEIMDKNHLSDEVALIEAQHILDRIIFTYFVCEKGLVSVKGYGPISGKELFSNIIEPKKSKTWDYLKKLFFEQFAKKNSGDLDCEDNVHLQVKYLNGGLFRENKISDKKISESNLKIEFEWKDIFDTLNKYTWMIEDTWTIEDKIFNFKGEYEGNLTPEVMGHIYEKFVISIGGLDEIKINDLEVDEEGELIKKTLKGNKKIGAYYTPEDITDFISRNVVLSHILEQLEMRNEYQDFNSLLNDLDNENLKKVLDILKKVKVCDPSCGSGAFLLKTGEILLEFQLNIKNALNEHDIDMYALKKEIIVNNLHGVDINEGAVEICKLRLWLWIISSYSPNEELDPLPNIEYNFLVGNSLIGWINEKLKQQIIIQLDKMAILAINSLKVGFEDQEEIIDTAMNMLNQQDLESYIKVISHLKKLYSNSDGPQAVALNETISGIRSLIYENVNIAYSGYMSEKGVKISPNQLKDINPFHWIIDFNEIFENGGFDIIVGNPPYGNITKGKAKSWVNKTYNCSKARNIAETFFEKTLDSLLRKEGYMGYVIPKTISFYSSWIEIRNKILNKDLIYTYDVGIGFVGVNYEELVLIIKNDSNYNNEVKIFSSKNLKSPFKDKKAIFIGTALQEHMKKTNTIIFRPIDELEREIISLINKNSLKLKEITTEKAFRGLYISDKEKSKFVEGPVKWVNKVPDVKKNYLESDKIINIALKDEWGKKANKIMKPRLFFKVLRGKRLVCYADIKGEYLTTEKLVNVIVNPEYHLETLMLIINSYIPSFYIQKMLFSETTETSRVMDDMYVGFIPIPKNIPEIQDSFIKLHNFMIFLNKDKSLRTSQSKNINFLNSIIDCLIHEMFLKEELNTSLFELIDSQLNTINKSENKVDLGMIIDTINTINSCREIDEEINKIKDHKWVKLIENM